MKLILQTPQEKTNLKVLFALFERHLSLWGHEHWKTRTSEHINANQATLHFLAETWFLLFMLNPKTHRNKAFYRKHRKRKSTGTGISDRKPHAGQIRWPSGQFWALFPPPRTYKIHLELQLHWSGNESNQATFTRINHLCSSFLRYQFKYLRITSHVIFKQQQSSTKHGWKSFYLPRNPTVTLELNNILSEYTQTGRIELICVVNVIQLKC